MSCNCSNTAGCNGGCCRDNPCTPCPSESAACETLPSALNNFIQQFFGSLEKSVVNGSVVWTLPCNLEAGLENNPRMPDEGLACYFLRLFQDGIIGAQGPAGQTGPAGEDGKNAFTVTLCQFTQPAEGGTYQVDVFSNPLVQEGQTLYVTGSGYAEVLSVIGSTLTMRLISGTVAEGTVVDLGKLVVISGPQGIPGTAAAQGDPGPQGPQGDPGPQGPQGVSAYTTTLANFTQPALNATVVVSVDSSDPFAIGQHVYVATGGNYEVTNKAAGSLTLKNVLAANAAPGATIVASSLVTAAGAPGNPGDTVVFSVAVTGKGDVLVGGTDAAYFRAPFAFELTEVRASLDVASSGANVEVDVNDDGASVFSTVLSIDTGDLTSVGATTPAVISNPTIADDSEITFDIDVAGTGAEYLIVTLIGNKL